MTLGDTVLRGLREAAGAADPSGERYVLIEEIGRGGMGTVHRAQDTVLNREVALKVLNRGAAIQDEARLTAQLEHPGIIPVHDAGHLDDGRVFYAMKLVRGQRLDDWIRAGPSLPERLNVFIRICEPVAFAHSRGVIHRDLKPANVMIGSFGEVLVLDWGIACAQGEEQEAGTPGFSAPESDSTQAADVYSLGCILSTLLPAQAPKPLQSICRRASEAVPAHRYRSIVELSSEIKRFLSGERVLAHRENLLERAQRVADKHKALLALLAAYLVMRTALLVYSALR
jgi:serine/threonine protein kinase